MIRVQNLIDQWEERLIDYPKENETARLIRDTIAVLELLETPLSEQGRKDLDLMQRVRSGQVKKCVCHDYAIYNGDWYREHPWNLPKEQEPVKVRCIFRRTKIMEGVCPSCEMRITSTKEGHRMTKFCQYCGQAVKWGE